MGLGAAWQDQFRHGTATQRKDCFIYVIETEQGWTAYGRTRHSATTQDKDFLIYIIVLSWRDWAGRGEVRQSEARIFLFMLSYHCDSARRDSARLGAARQGKDYFIYIIAVRRGQARRDSAGQRLATQGKDYFIYINSWRGLGVA